MSNAGGGGSDGGSGIPNAGTLSSYSIASSCGEGRLVNNYTITNNTSAAASHNADPAYNALSSAPPAPLSPGASNTLGRSTSMRPRNTPPPPPPTVAKESEDTKL